MILEACRVNLSSAHKASLRHVLKDLLQPHGRKLHHPFQEVVSRRKLLVDNKDIRKFTLSSPSLWASFHPLTHLLVVSVK
jgi:hypothetical protein